ACARSHFPSRVNQLAVESPRAREAAAGPAAVLFGCFLFSGRRRRAVAAWPPSYGVASARAGSRARAYAPRCPRSPHFPRARAARPPYHTPSRPHHCIIIENPTSLPILPHLTRARVFKICHHPAGATASYRVVLSRECSFFPFWSTVVALRSTPGVKSNDRTE